MTGMDTDAVVPGHHSIVVAKLCWRSTQPYWLRLPLTAVRWPADLPPGDHAGQGAHPQDGPQVLAHVGAGAGQEHVHVEQAADQPAHEVMGS